jgi:hypothetical protein
MLLCNSQILMKENYVAGKKIFEKSKELLIPE